jgi:hypothetical protein
VARLGDQHPAVHAHDALRFAQHRLHVARVLAVHASPGAREGGRLHGPQIEQPSLGLGHDFLGDHQDVAIPQAGPRGQRIGEARHEVVTRVNLAQSP